MDIFVDCPNASCFSVGSVKINCTQYRRRWRRLRLLRINKSASKLSASGSIFKRAGYTKWWLPDRLAVVVGPFAPIVQIINIAIEYFSLFNYAATLSSDFAKPEKALKYFTTITVVSTRLLGSTTGRKFCHIDITSTPWYVTRAKKALPSLPHSRAIVTTAPCEWPSGWCRFLFYNYKQEIKRIIINVL